jgi:hypothetical protein
LAAFLIFIIFLITAGLAAAPAAAGVAGVAGVATMDDSFGIGGVSFFCLYYSSFSAIYINFLLVVMLKSEGINRISRNSIEKVLRLRIWRCPE